MILTLNEVVELQKVKDACGIIDNKPVISACNIDDIMAVLRDVGIDEVKVSGSQMHWLIMCVNSYINKEAKNIDNSSELFELITKGNLKEFLGVKLKLI